MAVTQNQYASIAVFTISPAITRRKIFRTNPLPRLNATAVPRPAPTMFTVAIGKTSDHQITPLDAKTTMAAAFVAALSAFAAAEA